MDPSLVHTEIGGVTEVTDDNVGSLGGEPISDGSTDPLSAARDDGSGSGEVPHCAVYPPSSERFAPLM